LAPKPRLTTKILKDEEDIAIEVQYRRPPTEPEKEEKEKVEKLWTGRDQRTLGLPDGERLIHDEF